MFAKSGLKAVFRQSVWNKSAKSLFTSTFLAGKYDKEFTEAQKRLKTLTEDPGNEVKLDLYALFKQATVGKCKAPRPGMMDFVGKAKWDAWNKLGEMTQDDAQLAYAEYIGKLSKSDTPTNEPESTPNPAASSLKHIKVENRGNMDVITLNRPKKKNALNREMYQEITETLHSLGSSPAAITIVTGAGDFFCSGNDLENFAGIDPKDIRKMAESGAELLKMYVDSFIDHPKPLIAVVNGPAIGIAVTVLGLFDAVYATDRATFVTPFSALGQSPEGCSSFTFPKIMGPTKASEMMLFGRVLTAKDAMDAGLVNQVFHDRVFQQEVWALVEKYSDLPKQSLRLSKKLLRDVDRATLHEVNKRECDLLTERWQSQECLEAVMNFFQRKST